MTCRLRAADRALFVTLVSLAHQDGLDGRAYADRTGLAPRGACRAGLDRELQHAWLKGRSAARKRQQEH